MKSPHSKKVWLILVFAIIFGQSAYAEISEEKAIHCILGEGRLEYMKFGYNSLLALAESLRNRGTTQGVYGCNVDLSKEARYIELKGIKNAAARAWRESISSNLVKGATYWGSTIVDKNWIEKMKKNGYTLTYKIGNHQFYKEN